jgi:hypothetical protein
MYLSKLTTAQVVTSTPPENLVGKPYEIQNQNFDFGTPQTLILYARSIFLRGVSNLNKILSKKVLLLKTLSNLGALLVLNNLHLSIFETEKGKLHSLLQQRFEDYFLYR